MPVVPRVADGNLQRATTGVGGDEADTDRQAGRQACSRCWNVDLTPVVEAGFPREHTYALGCADSTRLQSIASSTWQGDVAVAVAVHAPSSEPWPRSCKGAERSGANRTEPNRTEQNRNARWNRPPQTRRASRWGEDGVCVCDRHCHRGKVAAAERAGWRKWRTNTTRGDAR